MPLSNECANKSAHNSSEKEKLSEEELLEMKERVAVRFLIKKTKRFDYSKNPPPPQSLVAAPKKSVHECLYYLGLIPTLPDEFQEKEEDKDAHLFQKPSVYECNICLKFFLHKRPYRKHMIYHMKQTYRCIFCRQGFTSMLPKKKHEYFCRHVTRKRSSLKK